MVAVLPGVWDTFAKALRLNSLFKSDDLPTFERPANAISGTVEGGSCDEMPNDRSKATLLMFMMRSLRSLPRAVRCGGAVVVTSMVAQRRPACTENPNLSAGERFRGRWLCIGRRALCGVLCDLDQKGRRKAAWPSNLFRRMPARHF